MFGRLWAQMEEVHVEVGHNSPQHCSDRVRRGQTSPVSLFNLLKYAAAMSMPAAQI